MPNRTDRPKTDLGTRPRVLEAGAKLVEGFLTEAETAACLKVVRRRRWRRWVDRSVQQYGGAIRYDPKTLATHVDKRPKLPEWAANTAARIAGIAEMQPATECTVNRYRPGQCLAMHLDDSWFGPTIAMLTLTGGWPMRFRRLTENPDYTENGLETDDRIVLKSGSLLLLEGDARDRWLHGIDRRDGAGQPDVRISATFRQLPGGQAVR